MSTELITCSIFRFVSDYGWGLEGFRAEYSTNDYDYNGASTTPGEAGIKVL